MFWQKVARSCSHLTFAQQWRGADRRDLGSHSHSYTPETSCYLEMERAKPRRSNFIKGQKGKSQYIACIFRTQDALFAVGYAYAFESDPSPLAFPYPNNELTQPNHAQQYHSVCECED